MSYYTLSITPDIQTVIQKLNSGLNALQTEFIYGLAEDARAKAKQNASRGRPGLYRRSGRLAEAIYGTPHSGSSFGDEGDVTLGVDLYDVPYAAIHERGGIIRPHGKYLTFQIGGRWIRARQVRIPKRPYLEPAARDVTSVGSLRQRLELTISSLEGRGLL
jgi:phage gpG-like protein